MLLISFLTKILNDFELLKMVQVWGQFFDEKSKHIAQYNVENFKPCNGL